MPGLIRRRYIVLNGVTDQTKFGSTMQWLVMVDKQDPEGEVYGSAELWPRTAYLLPPLAREVTEQRAAAL